MAQLIHGFISKVAEFIQTPVEIGRTTLIAGVAISALAGEAQNPPPATVNPVVQQIRFEDKSSLRILCGDEIDEIITTLAEDEQQTFIDNSLLLIRESDQAFSNLQAMKILHKIPVKEQKELIEQATPLFQSITDSFGRAKILEALRKTPSQNRQDLVADALPLIQGVSNQLKRLQILKIFDEIPASERRALIHQAETLLAKITSGYDRARIVKVLQSLSPEERVTYANLMLSIIQKASDPLNQEKIISCLLKVRTQDFSNVIEHVQTLIDSLQDENEFVVVIEALTTSYGEKVIVNRSDLANNPGLYIHQAVSKTSPIKVHFLGENGADGGGLWREFVTLAFEASIQDRALFSIDKNTQFASPSYASNDYDRFKELGELMGIVIERGDAVTGPLFQKEVFNALLAFTPEELSTTVLSDATKFKIARAYLNHPNYEFTFQLLEKDQWDADDLELAKDCLGVSSIEEGRQDLFGKIPFQSLHAMAVGLRSKTDTSALTPNGLMDRLQGTCDPVKISNLVQYEGVNPSVQQQTTWLKEWIRESSENAQAFLLFATSNKALPLNLSKITVYHHDHMTKFPTAQTCAHYISLSAKSFVHKEEFIDCLKEAIASSPGFGQR